MNQVSQIYKTGEIEDCTSILTDWTLCIQAKAYYKEADKQVSWYEAANTSTAFYNKRSADYSLFYSSTIVLTLPLILTHL